MNSKLIKPEREINTITNQIRGKMGRSGAFRQNGLAPAQLAKLAKLANLAKQKLAAIVAFCRIRGMAIAAWIRKLIDVAIRGASFSANARTKRSIPTLERPASPQRLASADVGKLAVTLVCVCLGLMSVGAVVGVVFLVQIHGLKTDMAQMAHEFAATKVRLNQLEKVARQTEAEAVSNRTAKAQPKQPPLVLSAADIQIVRQYIKVAPPQPGAQPNMNAWMLRSSGRTPQAPFALSRDEIQLIRDFVKVPPPLPGAARNINVGDLLLGIALAPLPEPIMEKVPKLRGARFTVDRNGAIVVVAPGTNRVDVIINPS